VLERLTNRGEAGDDVGSGLNVVESQDRDIFGDFETRVVKSADAAYRGNIVEAKQGGEVFALKQELMGDRIAEFGCVEVFIELDDEIVGDFERESAGDLHGGLPTALRV